MMVVTRGRKCQFSEKQVFRFLCRFKKHVVALPQILIRIVWYSISNIVYCPIISVWHRCMMCGNETSPGSSAAPEGSELGCEPRSCNGKAPRCRVTPSDDIGYFSCAPCGQVPFSLCAASSLQTYRTHLRRGIRAGDCGGVAKLEFVARAQTSKKVARLDRRRAAGARHPPRSATQGSAGNSAIACPSLRGSDAP
jgi:hypothetical protein